MKKLISIIMISSNLSLWGGLAEDEALLKEIYFLKATPESVEELISKGADPDCIGVVFLKEEPREGYTDPVECYIKFQAIYSKSRNIEEVESNIFTHETTPLKMLFDNYFDNYYLSTFDQESTFAIAQVLIDNGASVEKNFSFGPERNDQMFYMFVACEEHEIVDFLIKNGAAPNCIRMIKEQIEVCDLLHNLSTEKINDTQWRLESMNSASIMINWSVAHLLAENPGDSDLASIAEITDRDEKIERLKSYLKLF